MNKAIAVCLLAVALSACSDNEGATRVLLDAGYTDVKADGYAFWGGCGEDDTYVTKFTAKGPTGRPVSGVVCSGLFFKNSTIRLD